MRKAAPFLALLLSCTLACGDARDADPDAGIMIDTLASGAIHVSNPAEGSWGEGEAWRAVEMVRIGSALEEGPASFGSVWDVAVDAYDRVYVLDRPSAEVRVFSPAGEHVRTIGRKGEGPGELSGPIALAFGPAWELWVVDPGTQRYTVFDTAGALRTTYPRSARAYGLNWDVHRDGAGNWWEPSSRPTADGTESEIIFIRYEVGDEALAGADTFPVPWPEDGGDSFVIESEGRTSYRPVPFAPQFVWRFDGERGFWLGTGETYRLYHASVRGDTLRIVERPYEPIPVAPEERDRALAWVDELPPQGRRQVDLSRVPDVKPPYDALVVDDRGFVWVSAQFKNYGDPSTGSPFDVFDPEGRYLGRVRTDLGRYPLPHIAGDRMVGVARDELGIAVVILYRIEGRPPAAPGATETRL